jgi:hypothetical protein
MNGPDGKSLERGQEVADSRDHNWMPFALLSLQPQMVTWGIHKVLPQRDSFMCFC